MPQDPLNALLSLPSQKLERVGDPELSDLAVSRRTAPTSPKNTIFRLPYMTYDQVQEGSNDMYDPLDFTEVGNRIRTNVVKAIEKRFPVIGDKYTLKVENVHYEKQKNTTKADERRIILEDGSLNDRLKGEWVLYDNETGKELQRKSATLLNVPRMTSRGTFIRNGSELGLKHMFRLRPGIYTRIKNNGVVAAHINPQQTTGRQMSLDMDPATGTFSVGRGTRTYGLLPILTAAGVEEDTIKAVWGEELFNANKAKYGKLMNKGSKSEEEYRNLWTNDIAPILLDKETTESTLGMGFDKMDPQALLLATKRILQVSQTMDESDTDDRDSLQYQRIMGPADYIPERIVRDGGGLLRNLFNMVAKTGTLDHIETGAFQPQVDSVFLSDKHAGYIDGSSPVEAYDFASGVSRIGEGGIGDTRAAPAETRGVNNSYLGFIDPIRSPESTKVGLDVFLTYGVKKDSNGNLYNKFINKTGKTEWSRMDKVAKSIVATPEFFNPEADPEEFIPAIVRGKTLDYVQRKDVDYYVPNANRMLSMGAGMIPLIGGIRSNRTMMGCLHPDTLLCVYRDGGYKHIYAKDYIADWRTSDLMVSLDSDNSKILRPVLGVRKTENDLALFKVTTVTGKSALVNSTHKWLSFINKSNVVKVVPTVELTTDTFIPVDFVAPERKKHTFNMGGIKPPKIRNFTNLDVELDSDISWLLGIYAAEGCVRYKTGELSEDTIYGIHIANTEREILVKAAEIIGVKFGVRATVGKTRRYPEGQGVVVNSKQLGILFYRLMGGTSHTKKVPECIMNSDKTCMMAFVAGYLDGDGGVIVGKTRTRVRAATVSEKLCIGLTSILGSLGVTTFYNQYKNKYGNIYYLEIAKKCLNKITGLSCHRKMSKIAEANSHCNKDTINVPVTSEMLERCNYLYGGRSSQSKRMRTGRVSAEFLIKNNIKSSDIISGVGWERIVSIEKAGEADYLVDIDIDDNVYMLANGMFTHNSKYANQGVPLEHGEAPLVQRALTLDDGTETTSEAHLGKQLGARRSPVDGQVVGVSGDEIIIKDKLGQKHSIDLYRELPANQKGFLNNIPIIKVGDRIGEGQVIARSNYTNDEGVAALGKNLKVAFLSARGGGTFEDGITISESAADKLKSEQLYKVRGELTDDIEYNKDKFLSLFKQEYTDEQLAKIGDDGLPRPGAVFNEGDPVFLGVQTRDIGVHGLSRNSAVPYVHTWEHEDSGTVLDVVRGKKHLSVYAKAYTPMKVGDKMCFDDKTEVLTDAGWKLFKDLTGTERVLTLDVKSGDTFMAEYTKVYQYYHKGRMYSAKSSKVDILVTDKHKIPVSCLPASAYIRMMEPPEIFGKALYFLTGHDIFKPESYAYMKDPDFVESWEMYEGYVYCLTVPQTHIMYVKRNGKCCWSGNSNRFGAKGVVAKILPDSQMPIGADGERFDVLQSPLGLPSRLNTSQLCEALLGKIAKATGTTYALPDFLPENDDIISFTDRELKKAGLSASEDVYDPVSGKTIPGIETGNMFFYKLKHMSELKERGRSTGLYSAEEIPMKGEGAARRFGSMEASAVYSGGGEEVLRDAKIIRGQRNDEFWRDFRSGKYPKTPGIPLVHKKFFAHLQAAGIHLEDRADRVHIYGATNDDMKKLSGTRKVTAAATFDSKNLQPIDGGLFDPNIFGADGDQWGYVELPEPVLNPMMFKTIGSVLGWKDKELAEYLTGSRQVDGKFGSQALKEMLDGINLEGELRKAKNLLKSSHTTLQQRDLARKRIRAIEPMLREGKKPSDFFWDRVPILPPRFRAVTAMANGTNIVADANFLYKRLMDSIGDLNDAKAKLPEDMQLDARESVYNALGAVTGLTPTDDPKLESKGVAGVLKWAFGKGSPKLSAAHRKVFGANLDLGSLATITADDSLTIDQVGIPERSAWKMFEPFVVRRLTQQGYTLADATRAVISQNDDAERALKAEMAKRPILVNRAPTLWRYGIQGMYPVMVKDNTIHMNPNVCKSYAADFDGDSMTTHVPVSNEAVEAIKKSMLPSKNLLSPRDFSAHFIPRAEFAQGLYLASRADDKQRPVRFRTEEEAVSAYKRGDIKVDTPVEIG